jgi:hypothetical protein
MKTLVLSILLLVTLSINAQSDTLWNGNTFTVGKVTSINGDMIVLDEGKEAHTYGLITVTKLSISQSNPNKLALESSYMTWLSNHGIYGNNSVVVKPSNKYYPQLTGGFFLRRGANRILGGVGVNLAAGVIGGVMIAAMEKPTAGIVVVGVGQLVGFIMEIAGVSDFKMAGELFDRNKQ